MSSSQMEKRYFEKCLALLNSEQFVKSNQDPTAITERKVQQILRKIRQLFKNKNYQKKYMKSYIQQAGLSAGKFYGIAKIHKLSRNQGI